jgi:hypothetical protein
MHWQGIEQFGERPRGDGSLRAGVYTEYADPKRSECITEIQPALKKLPLHALVKACGERLSRRELIELRARRSRPHRKTRELLELILKKLGFLYKIAFGEFTIG